ncbi:hypothetical protein B0H13DRAFT_1942093 [Mycena leptocephala]|nr:hypothetical protein B0H13DRAFT_1942093 [Mycena leptocephala]
MFSLSFKLTAAIALVVASSVTATPTRRQMCSPQFTPGTGYDIQSSINDTFVWLFNGASAGSPSAVHLEVIPLGIQPWFFTETSNGGWTISIDSPAVTCVLAPSNALLTTGSCTSSSADLTISCASHGDPSIRSAECTGSPQQLWNVVTP